MQICERRIDIVARRGNWAAESFQDRGEVRTSTTFATLRAPVVSIWVNELDEVETVEARGLQIKYTELSLGRELHKMLLLT